MLKAVNEWLANTKTANFFVYTEHGYKESMSDAIAKDNVTVLIAAIVMSLYLIIFLGSFSPIHCRLVVALAGILSVVLSFFSGFGLLYYFGHETSDFHAWLPFLMMAIGSEHMFVVCNAVDRTDLEQNAYIRIHEALSYAGPEITITSLTTCCAFLFGLISSLEALRSFCLFSFVSILMLYLS